VQGPLIFPRAEVASMEIETSLSTSLSVALSEPLS
jgi:hypothetical protein